MKQQSRKKITTISTLLLIVLVATLLSACSSNSNTQSENTTNGAEQSFDTVLINSKGSFDQAFCKQYNLEDKAIMIESEYCGHCQETKPDFKAAMKQTGVNAEIIDVAVKGENQRLEDEYGIQIQYTPTFIVGCDYFVGAKDKEEYVTLLNALN